MYIYKLMEAWGLVMGGRGRAHGFHRVFDRVESGGAFCLRGKTGNFRRSTIGMGGWQITGRSCSGGCWRGFCRGRGVNFRGCGLIHFLLFTLVLHVLIFIGILVVINKRSLQVTVKLIRNKLKKVKLIRINIK